MTSFVRRVVAIPIFALVVSTHLGLAQEATGTDDDRLVVGITASPPFSFRAEQDAQVEGISVALWNHLTTELGLQFSYLEVTVPELLAGLESGEINVGAAALETTAERERVMNFSHSYYSSGLSVATGTREASVVVGFLKQVFSWQALAALGGLTLTLLGVGFIVWLLEHKANPDQFGGEPVEGIGKGLWWSAVTMTTVGYGDKVPVSLPGRLVGLVWMFASIIFISGFTGAIASALTVSSIQPTIEDLDDMRRSVVGVIAGSTAAKFLDREGIRYVAFEDTLSGLAAVEHGSIDGFVNDRPVLQYFVDTQFPGKLTVIDQTFNRGYYALALTNSFSREEELNTALLEYIRTPDWTTTVNRYTGE